MNKYEENKILEIVCGSHLYGTNTPESDKDFVGVMIGDEDTYLGLENVEEVDLSIKSKGEDGKNDKDAIDRKLFEVRNFMKLALQNNPNIIEILFVNPENIVSINNYGRWMLQNKNLFPWRGAKQRFLGYAFSQKHKMIIRTDHHFELNNAYEYFSEKMEKDVVEGSVHPGIVLLAEYRNKNLPFLKFSKGTSCQIGDLSFDMSRKIKDVVKMLKERLDKQTNRSGLMEKYGYDTKFASHLIRLMMEGKELLITGEIQFPLKEKDFILDVKLGKYKIKDVLDYSDQLEHEIVDVEKISPLPSKPNYQEVNKLLKEIVKEALFT